VLSKNHDPNSEDAVPEYSRKFMICPAVPIRSRKARYSEFSLKAAQSRRLLLYSRSAIDKWHMPVYPTIDGYHHHH
jgi:hypothetical protein